MNFRIMQYLTALRTARRLLDENGAVLTALNVRDRAMRGVEGQILGVAQGRTLAGKDEMLHLLCQRRNKAGAFHYLGVPAKFIRDRLDEFAVINGSHVNLFLDAADEPFIDWGGPGLIAFARFEVE